MPELSRPSLLPDCFQVFSNHSDAGILGVDQ